MQYTTWQRAQKCIAQGALTNSKHPDRFVKGVYPTHVSAGGPGGVIADGRSYHDYICGLGCNLVGQSNPYVLEAVILAAHKGFSHSLPTVYEVETAEALKEIFYFVDKFKFLKTGSEAASAAIKMARAATGRQIVLSEGYHGWHDLFISLTPPAAGVAGEFHTFKLGKLEEISVPEKIAAIIVEPVITDWQPARQGQLQALREFCTKHGIVLIFDEIITGFRFLNHSVSRHFNIVPDLVLLGKAIANGMPLAAVGGRAEIMDGDYFVSSTYAGEILSLAATRAVCSVLTSKPAYCISKLWETGERFLKTFNELGGEHLKILGYPTRGVFVGSDINRALFFQESCRAGMLFGPSWFYNFDLVHNDYAFFSFFKEFMKRLTGGTIQLLGHMPTSAFAQRVRG